MQIATLEGIFDELQKIGASSRMAGYMQARRGTRPIRAHNLATKGFVQQDEVPQPPDMDQPPEPEPVREEDEGSAIGKVAAAKEKKQIKILDKESREKAMMGFAKARPYVSSAAQAAVPAALLGGVYGGKRTAKILGTIGAAGGLINQGLKDWARGHKRKAVAKKILGTEKK